MGIKGAQGYFQKHGIANRLEKRALLIAVNLVAGLSIFFFGYDQGLFTEHASRSLSDVSQGVMGGVNTNRSYSETMGFGHWDESTQLTQVTKPLLQGGIVRAHQIYNSRRVGTRTVLTVNRQPYTTFLAPS